MQVYKDIVKFWGPSCMELRRALNVTVRFTYSQILGSVVHGRTYGDLNFDQSDFNDQIQGAVRILAPEFDHTIYIIKFWGPSIPGRTCRPIMTALVL